MTPSLLLARPHPFIATHVEPLLDRFAVSRPETALPIFCINP